VKEFEKNYICIHEELGEQRNIKQETKILKNKDPKIEPWETSERTNK